MIATVSREIFYVVQFNTKSSLMTRQLTQTKMPISILPEMLPHIIPNLSTDMTSEEETK